MGQKSSSGCLIAVIVAVVLGAIAFFGLIGLNFMRWGQAREHAVEISAQIAGTGAGGNAGTIIFQKNDLPRFSPHRSGKELTREQFVALMIDDFATDLSREALQKTANNSTVKWLLKTQDLSERNGTLEGRFTLPWEIRSPHGGSGSSINLNCEFTEESRNSLLAIRRGDWVVVEGMLSLNGKQATIKEARIFDELAAPYAERPQIP